MVFGLALLGSPAVLADWSCTNDFESGCSGDGCVLLQGEDFTPLSISVSDAGKLTVCAYTGCWEGQGRVLARSPFLVVLGEQLRWNHPGQDNPVDLLLSINLAKSTGALSSPHFDQPLYCTGGSRP